MLCTGQFNNRKHATQKHRNYGKENQTNAIFGKIHVCFQYTIFYVDGNQGYYVFLALLRICFLLLKLTNSTQTYNFRRSHALFGYFVCRLDV